MQQVSTTQTCPLGQSRVVLHSAWHGAPVRRAKQKPVPSAVLKQKQSGSPWQPEASKPHDPPVQVTASHLLPSHLPLQHWLAVASVQEPPFGIHEGWHIPLTHSSPSSQGLKQLPQCLSFVCRFTHLPLQQVWVDRQRLEQLPQWRSFVLRFTHLSPQRVCPSGHRSSSAQATPGREPSAPPTRRPPINLRALPREREPLARALVSSSKERLVVRSLTCCHHSPQGGTLGD
jgi:hypothetical protein